MIPGHCGSQASTYVNDVLHNMIFQHPFFDYDIELAIRECCEQIDKVSQSVSQCSTTTTLM
jgi:hypothetical protein